MAFGSYAGKKLLYIPPQCDKNIHGMISAEFCPECRIASKN